MATSPIAEILAKYPKDRWVVAAGEMWWMAVPADVTASVVRGGLARFLKRLNGMGAYEDFQFSRKDREALFRYLKHRLEDEAAPSARVTLQ